MQSAECRNEFFQQKLPDFIIFTLPHQGIEESFIFADHPGDQIIPAGDPLQSYQRGAHFRGGKTAFFNGVRTVQDFEWTRGLEVTAELIDKTGQVVAFYKKLPHLTGTDLFPVFE